MILRRLSLGDKLRVFLNKEPISFLLSVIIGKAEQRRQRWQKIAREAGKTDEEYDRIAEAFLERLNEEDDEDEEDE